MVQSGKDDVWNDNPSHHHFGQNNRENAGTIFNISIPDFFARKRMGWIAGSASLVSLLSCEQSSLSFHYFEQR
jgi:hypothetical protein